MGLFNFLKLSAPQRSTVAKMERRIRKMHRNLVHNLGLQTHRPKSPFYAKQKVNFSMLSKAKLTEIESNAASKQHSKGKLTARERVATLLDEDTFIEIGQFAGADLANDKLEGAGVITGFGNVNGKKCAVYAQDFTVQGGSLGEVEGQKICNIIDLALQKRIPVVAMLDSGGARIQEGVGALGYYGRIFKKTAAASGVIPQISLILGPCAGGAVYCPALTDFIVMTEENSHMFVTGPDVVRSVTGEKVSADELGGGEMHASKSGVCHYLARTEEEAIEWTRVLLSFMPSSSERSNEIYHYERTAQDDKCAAFLETVVPENAKQAYDVLDVIYSLLDYEEFIEIHALFAPSVVCGLGRINGETVAVVANQPQFNAGTLDIDASEKLARFVQFADSFNIPVLTLVDVPGYRPGTNQEHAGIIRRGAKVITAYASATVPLITVILRKAYGGAYIVMGSKEIGADINLAWPSAEIAVLGAEGAVQIVHRKRLKDAEAAGEDVEELKARLIDEYTKKTINANLSQEKGAVDALISPKDTRRYIINALDLLREKKVEEVKRKHSNQPL
ncbi:MAG: acyl-CoA carboxylase subunit beta [Candidatus Ancillula sp.]|jgi:acetyl-CoA carboxylase carboxyltransferase component|nr:acyl-CoA carboxylase subunit beta [Candidatus Ancillula sp.]